MKKEKTDKREIKIIEEKGVEEEEEEEENGTEAPTQYQEKEEVTDSLNAVEDEEGGGGGVEGRSHRGGANRRGSLVGHHLSRPKVIVTAHSQPGQMLDDSIAMDRNLPPPRLPEDSNQGPPSAYRVNYPGAKLTVAAPRPSHLSHGGVLSATRRDEPPQSINFGSSSYSTGAFHASREQDGQPDYRQQPEAATPYNIPRTPITYYRPAHQPINPEVVLPQNQRPRLQFPRQRPHPPPSRDPNRPEFKPSKLLPPFTFSPEITEEMEEADSATTLPSLALPPQGPPTHTSPKRILNNSEGDPMVNRERSSSPPRRGQVVNAPRPALSGANGDSTASLTPLGTLSKLGVRQEIDHRAGSAGSRDVSTGPHLWPPVQNIPGRQHGMGYKLQEDGSYTFISGEVYTPPPLVKRPLPSSSKKPFRITTRRPAPDLPVIPFEDNVSTYVPRYVKEAIAEVEFESKTFETPQSPVFHPHPNWFLMPVQGWFVLSIILAALVIILVVVCAILYNSLRKQKRKVKKLLSSSLMLPTCLDPVNHELCQCRSLSPLVRSHTLMSRASVMSRTSHRTLRPASRRQGVINYDNEAQQRTTGFRSLPNPALMDREKDNNLDSITTTHTQVEIEDTPPPLAPKKSSLTGTTAGGQDSKGGGGGGGNYESREGPLGGRESRAGNHDTRSLLGGMGGLGGMGFRETRLGLPEGRSSALGSYNTSYGGKGTSTQHQRSVFPNADVQLTTIYPPPRRFEL